jgi:hypothetical protein
VPSRFSQGRNRPSQIQIFPKRRNNPVLYYANKTKIVQLIGRWQTSHCQIATLPHSSFRQDKTLDDSGCFDCLIQPSCPTLGGRSKGVCPPLLTINSANFAETSMKLEANNYLATRPLTFFPVMRNSPPMLRKEARSLSINLIILN